MRRLWVVLLGVFAVVLATLPAVAAPAPGDPPKKEHKHRKSFDDSTVTAARAKATGKRQELESQRREASTSYIEPSGRTSEVITSRPTRVSKGGKLREIDTDLTKRGSRLEPVAAQADVSIAQDPDPSGSLATIEQDSRTLGLGWDESLPAAKVKGPRASFAAGKNRRVEVTATDAGFNFRVVLDSKPARAPVYRIPVAASGVKLDQGEDGGFVATDGSGEVVFRIAPTIMWDHTQDGLEAGPEQTMPVASRLTERNGRQVIELRPDFAWLSDPARVYPTTIDPDTYINYLPDAARSTYTQTAAPENVTSHATSSLMRVGYHPSVGRTYSYVMRPIPARQGGAVVSATLRLYQYDGGSCTPTPMTIYPLSSAFADSLTSASNPQPSFNANSPYKVTKSFAHGIDGTGGCPNATETIDVTSMVKAWLSYTPAGIDSTGQLVPQVGIPNYGITLRASDTDTNAYKAFCTVKLNPSGTSCYSVDRQPTLTITYNTEPSVVHDMSQAPSTCYNGDAPSVTTLTPTLTGTAIDVDTDPQAAGGDTGKEKVRIRFEIWPPTAGEFTDPYVQDPNTGPTAPRVLDWVSPYVEQGTPVSWTVPANTLTDGTRYIWRAIANDGTSDSREWSAWRVFSTDTTETPRTDCVERVLDSPTAEAAATVLDGLVADHPDLYYRSSWSNLSGSVSLVAVRVPGQTDETTAANARQAAITAIYASDTLEIWQKGGATDPSVLDTSVVAYSGEALAQAADDISARQDANDPVLADVVEVAQELGRNIVTVTATNPTDALRAAMQTS